MNEWQRMTNELLVSEYEKLLWDIEMQTVHLEKLQRRFKSLRAYCLDKELNLPTIEEVLKLKG